MIDLKKTLDALRKRYKAGAVDKPTTYYLSLGDDEKWTLTLTPKTCKVAAGKVENADCVLKTSAELFQKMIDGTYKPGLTDFLTGRIKSNDPELLKTFQQAFGL